MIYNEAIKISDSFLLPTIKKLYGLEDYEISLINPHEGGRNVVYNCEKEGADAKIIRVSFLNDRTKEELLGEAEYVRYLYEHGGNVSNVISSHNGNLLEEIVYNGNIFIACVFEKAKGKQFVDNGYKYREGVPITEYYYNCGKALGKLHQLSKGYTPVNYRYSFFDKYNTTFIDELIPGSLPLLKEKLAELLKTLEGLHKDGESFGLVHFDYNDGNYMIDFETGDITVYDFDNSCFCWYMYDLADLWRNGVGWIQFEQDVNKRKEFMDNYFSTAVEGYKSETKIKDSMLEQLPLFIQVTLMENILDEFNYMRINGEEPECDEVLSYWIKCIEDDIPYVGFFHEIYSCSEPFEYEE